MVQTDEIFSLVRKPIRTTYPVFIHNKVSMATCKKMCQQLKAFVESLPKQQADMQKWFRCRCLFLFNFFSPAILQKIRARVTRWVCGKVAQIVAQPNFCQKIIQKNAKIAKICATCLCNFFKSCPKQTITHYGKFAQSGPPDKRHELPKTTRPSLRWLKVKRPQQMTL
jgi:hypothetical protein